LLLNRVFCLPQVAAYLLNALTSGYAYILWRRVPRDLQQSAWTLYGWFAGLMCLGSCFGAFTGGASMQWISSYYASDGLGMTPQQALIQSNVSTWGDASRATPTIMT
jgi:hypothetical protein